MELGQEYTREDQKAPSEVMLIDRMFGNTALGGVMVDVGAHYGGTSSIFARRGWKIVAFEPDPENRKPLIERYKDAPDVIIDPRAVSDHAEAARPFYASDVSTGISGLSSFHATHHEVGTVAVTTLGDALREHGVDHVTFLKIDVEGYDLPVLRGLDWEHIKPDVILCEFEDRKSQPLGYSYHDMSTFLVEKGYTVYVSEWYPIVEYGQKHNWRRFMRYPAELATEDAWGNLIAFRDPPAEDRLLKELDRLVNSAAPAASATSATRPAVTHPSQPLPQRAQSRLVTLAHYYMRWPGLVALGVIVFSMLAATDSALAPLFAGLSALLLLFLFGHTATRIRGG